ncbi:protein O-mannosyltransferase 1 [Neocloeon triangulifer]|uniref:protein O-mannosyltransferase 1 n=1 Tax=Neocloeon triangulifer TaxID=2078957 RepID=UPI00286F311B|nr:protein O-mannosyltransferase 1 [Neocloeon triangulifer]XP_059487785.1 protein O-mannosyltransferase 1 [Neocloeon triangulifer]
MGMLQVSEEDAQLRNRKAKKPKKDEKELQNNKKNEDKTKEDSQEVEREAKTKRSQRSPILQPHNVTLQPAVFRCQINISFDFVSIICLILGIATRFYNLTQPHSVVFDELHYGKYVSLYMKRTFFFDSQPPLGKQLIALAAYLGGYTGDFKFTAIGVAYSESFPLFAVRFIPALCGALLPLSVYHLLLQLGLKQLTAATAAFLILFDNALLTQSRFILMEPMLLLFSVLGLYCIQKFVHYQDSPYSFAWFSWLIIGTFFLSAAVCIKFVGACSMALGIYIVWRDFWRLVANKNLNIYSLVCQAFVRAIILFVVPVALYLSLFYVHLSILNKAGPHDSVMTSAFQASLEGGLASITKGQPLQVAHGSQITLRHSLGRTCWLHSHPAVYPVRYPDKRGSSHQQQVTCYSFKDVNNWWIVKRPTRSDLAVSRPIDAIKDGDIIQLVHGITSRALNSHDVAAPMSPQNQEVTCYIDYNISMPAQNLWRVDISNKDQVGDTWHTIESMVRLVHVNSSQALKFSGKQLPDWGYNQHEVVTDRVVQQDDTVWNVEEHRYTTSDDQKERERELVHAEMIPTRPTTLSFWDKILELHMKIFFASSDTLQDHMYSSQPIEWPLMTKGIAYWVNTTSNAQVHLIGNIAIWYSGTAALIIYLVVFVWYLCRMKRKVYDVCNDEWSRLYLMMEIAFCGYCVNMLPYFCMERTLFLHHYMPALLFKIILLAALTEHIFYVARTCRWNGFVYWPVQIAFFTWLGAIFYVFVAFAPLSYGNSAFKIEELLRLRWRDTWDFIMPRSALDIEMLF